MVSLSFFLIPHPPEDGIENKNKIKNKAKSASQLASLPNEVVSGRQVKSIHFTAPALDPFYHGSHVSGNRLNYSEVL